MDHDHYGYEVAAQMLLYSKCPGKHSNMCLQFDIMPKVHMSYANQVYVSPQMNQVTLSLGDQKGNYQHLTTNPCTSL
jgi:hypothetical protein